jgi:hypothetical protein
MNLICLFDFLLSVCAVRTMLWLVTFIDASTVSCAVDYVRFVIESNNVVSDECKRILYFLCFCDM